ncbi:linker histone H1 and H5 family protein [Opisthorchis viverrini]|uniref:Linker histone H1 and H5 family protein n=1 Tax=Opisthorchis viverrini TaxID=6198 RepID=A0A1S8XB59_OPIVI|nr:linker histone H1 and H5 family protein [Opisthorchis viverrini]
MFFVCGSRSTATPDLQDHIYGVGIGLPCSSCPIHYYGYEDFSAHSFSSTENLILPIQGPVVLHECIILYRDSSGGLRRTGHRTACRRPTRGLSAPVHAPAVSKKLRSTEPKIPANHPKVFGIVMTAFKAAKDRKNMSLLPIKKFIATNFKFDVERLGQHIRRGSQKDVLFRVGNKGKGLFLGQGYQKEGSCGEASGCQ